MVPKDANGKGKRDYVKEAVDYFIAKLEQYGDAEVPIKSLLGHRSQAPLEIRHVSGQHAKEFRDFLANHEPFCVRDEYVVLTKVLEKLERAGKGSAPLTRLPEEVSVDPYLTQQLVAFIERALFATNAANPAANGCTTSIESLFSELKAKHSEELWSRLVNNTNDLSTVLKMNSKLFQVQANAVSLTKERETQLDEAPQENVKDAPRKMNGTSRVQLQPLSSPDALPSPPSQLPQSQTLSPPATSPTKAPTMATLQQRMRSQIIKTINDNASMSYKGGNNGTSVANQGSGTFVDQNTVLRNTRLVSKTKEAEDIINEIITRGDAVGVDCEGINLGPSGSITLVQIATMTPHNRSLPAKVYIFDTFLNPDLLRGCLKNLFESERVVKVVHDCRNDSAALHFNYNIGLKNVFDTQVSAFVGRVELRKALTVVIYLLFRLAMPFCSNRITGSPPTNQSLFHSACSANYMETEWL